ncbi:relaxase/mobilization nuclease domain-containing protein [Nubsella zeaxanthinifaciens]|uniref:relaxase/mobilization nuclease domain-containing protein n=1 Tax=Nubsella zeaxanthinifaciens TaxID=392412 RepID=UPI000DE45255|nr:relaxase/mobilization nuclease domain-containing protein [Nubsella zeaxanthinifaciens]
MVTRIISGQSIRGLLIYNENKVAEMQASLIMASGFAMDIDGLDFRGKLNRFEHLTQLNQRVKTNALHIMLNFDRNDKVDTQKFQQIAQRYMERIGFGEQPFLVYHHKDVSHPHIHIVTTNIQPNGKRIDIHGIGRTLSETARKELETEFGLIKAEGRNKSEVLAVKAIDIEKVIYGKVPTKRAIYNVVSEVMRSYKFTSLAEYNAILKQFNVTADRGKEDTLMFEKRGLIYSLTDSKGNRVGIPFKASALATKPTLKEIEKKFERNREKRKPYKESIARRIEWVFGGYDSITKNTFMAELQKQHIGVVFRQNEQGFIYGATFIDHRTRSVFNGSDLGKSYGAKALTERFSSTDHKKTYLRPVRPQTTYLSNNKPTRYLAPIAPNRYLKEIIAPTSPNEPTMPRRKKKRKKGLRI